MRPIALLALVCALAARANAQCPTWLPELGGALAPDGALHALLVHDDDGPGPLPPALYVGGDFNQIGGIVTGCVARWDGQAWSAVGPLQPSLSTRAQHLAFYDEDGPGPLPPRLFASGSFEGLWPGSTLARFDGTQWISIQIGDPDAALVVADLDGPGPDPESLWVAGQYLASWNGSVLAPRGGFYPGASVAHANDACLFDPDGPGPQPARLVFTGSFTSVGVQPNPVPAQGLASYDGTNWSAFGGALDFPALFVLPVGQSLATRVDPQTLLPELVVAGRFAGAGGVPAPGIVRWEAGSFSALGGGIDLASGESVRALRYFDADGPGPIPEQLFAGGQFLVAGGLPVQNVARFDGTAWADAEGGVSGLVSAFAPFDADGPGPQPTALFTGGAFESANKLPSPGLARYTDHGCTLTFCAGDGTLPTACPCANNGAAGHGCGNSQDPAGGLLLFSGLAIAGTLHLDAMQMPFDTVCIFVQASGQHAAGVLLGDGVSCLGGQLLRLAVKQAFFGATGYPENELPIAQRSAQLGDPLHFGDVRLYQVVYRDGAPGFCNPAASYNITNGVRVSW
jgi:hypothetical protein